MNMMTNGKEYLKNETDGDQLFRIGLSEQLGYVFEWVCDNKKDICSFCEWWLTSPCFLQFFDDFTLFSQSYRYIYTVFSEDKNFCNIKDDADAVYDRDAAFWMGYLFTEWHMTRDANAYDIFRNNVLYICNNYEVLHTQSVQVAIDMIIEESPKLELEDDALKELMTKTSYYDIDFDEPVDELSENFC